MAFRMSENSLFAILLRSEWWYGALIGLAVIIISLLFVGGIYLPLGILGSLPFFGIAGYIGLKQAKLPSRKRVQEVDTKARTMTATQIADIVAAPYIKARYDSEAFKGSAADLELTRGNRKFLLSSKRFKVGNTGVEPLKQMIAAGEKVEATGYLYVALGKISDAAIDYAKKNDIELIQAGRLAEFFDEKANIS